MLRSAELISAARSCLLVVDMQERLVPVIEHQSAVVSSVRFLMDAAEVLSVPVVISEQYPRGLGSTVGALQSHPATVSTFEKLTFSAAAGILELIPDRLFLPERPEVGRELEPGRSAAEVGVANHGGPEELAESRLTAQSRLSHVEQIVVCGIEAHVCVLQTAMDLLAAGLKVFVAVDAMGSRRASDHVHAVERLRDAGCAVVTAESVVFEWCERAGTDVFRAVSRLVRERDGQR